MVMGLYILFSIISPFIKNKNVLNFDINELYRQGTVQATSNTENFKDNNYVDLEKNCKGNGSSKSSNAMNNRLEEIYSEKLEKDITQKLEEKGYEVEKCKVKTNLNTNKNEADKNINLNNKENLNVKQNNTGIEEIRLTLSLNENNIRTNEKSFNKTNNKIENKNITYTINEEEIKQFLINEYGVDEKCLKIN